MSGDRAAHAAVHRIGLIGAGIGGSLSPALHEREAATLGLQYRYRCLDIDDHDLSPDGAGDLMHRSIAAGYTGFNVTHPCKQVLLDECDELSADARALGAVNTITLEGGRIVGDNTDHSGFITGLRTGLQDVSLGRVAVLGAGGAGSAVAYGLLAAGARIVTVLDVDDDRRVALRDRLRGRFGPDRVATRAVAELPQVAEAADGIVNATPIGMDGHPGVPCDPAVLISRHWVADVVYRPLETEFLAAARTTGCAVVDGGAMLVAQAADTIALLTGVTPDLARMRAHLAELLESGPMGQTPLAS